nr:hypothetical protein [Tanacetum cinerariifolium]
MDNENKRYETCEEEEGYGEEDGFSSTEEYDLEDDCEAEIDEITETLDPHRDIEVAVGIEAVIEHYRTAKQKRRMPPIKNTEKALEQHGDGEENNHHDGIKPTYILDTIKAQVEIEVNRNQCKRAKALVMKRLERDVLNEYKKLNDYAKALVDTNPVNSVDIEVEHRGTGIPLYFKSMYVCLAAVREGFLDRCRKYLGLDGCFLKGVVKGMLLIAVGKDANNQMFPLAWGIVETESQSSWTWFLEHLKVDIKTKDGGEWTFMSDKQKGLLNVVQAIFPQAEHRLFAKCANKAQLRQRLDEIDNIQTSAKQSLENKDINQYCRAFFKSGTKCDCVDNNNTEAWNFVLISARSCKWKIKWNGADEFQVYYGRTQHCVHIGDKTCSCGAWQLSGIPLCSYWG